MLRCAIIVMAVLTAMPALAGDMGAEEARRFVTGKLFSYNCFEGTRGAGRVFADGSVVGTVQFQGAGPMRRAFLPAGTLKVKGAYVCASLRGMPIEPCFNLSRTDGNGFRGAISGLGFAYCDFNRQNPRLNIADRAQRARHAQSASHGRPLALRPAVTAENN